MNITNNKSGSFFISLFAYILLICFFLFIGYISAIYPICGDDFRFSYSCANGQRISSLYDAIQSQIYHYVHGLGRFIVHVLAQWFLGLDRIWYVLANTICYIVSTLLISNLTGRRFNAFHWLIVASTLWVIIPHTGCTVFSITGSFNYLWSILFNALFLWLLFSEKKSLNISALFVALVAGHCHESMSIAILVSVTMYCLFSGKRSPRVIISILIYILGFAANALAPSTLARIGASTGAEQLSFLQSVLRYASNTCKVIITLARNGDIGVVISVVLALITLACCTFIRLKKINCRWLLLTVSFLLGAFSSLALNIYTGVVYDRAFFGFCVVAYIAFLIMVFRTESRYGKYICGGLTLGSLFVAAHEVPQALRMVDLFNKRYSHIETEARKGVSIIPEYELWDACRASKYVESFGLSPCLKASVDESRFWRTNDFSVFPINQYDLLTSNKPLLLSMSEGEQRIFGDIMIVCTGERPVNANLLYFVDYRKTGLAKIIPKSLLQLYLQHAAKRKCSVSMPIFQLNDKYYIYISNSCERGKLIITYPGRSLEMELSPQFSDLSLRRR